MGPRRVAPGWLSHRDGQYGVVAPPPEQWLPAWRRNPYPPNIPLRPEWWWVGATGGVGTSSLAEATHTRGDAGHAWPVPLHGGPAGVVLVTRSTVRGLEAGLTAARQHASGRVPENVLLLGLVVVADAPGRLPKRIAEHLEVVRGAVPNLWRVGWCEPWRHRTSEEVLDQTPELIELVLAIQEAVELSPAPLWEPAPRTQARPGPVPVPHAAH